MSIINEIITQYEQFVTLDSQNISASLEDPSSYINKSRNNLREQLIAFDRTASQEEKIELFRYFISIYLRIGETSLAELNSKKPSYVPIAENQSTLFGEKHTGIWSGVAGSTPMTSSSDIRVNNELVMDRIFFVMNYYSKDYVPAFLEKTIDVLQKYSSSQKTLHNFTGDGTPKILLNPMTARITNFIQKTGAAFLVGLPHFEQKFSKFAEPTNNFSLKPLLKEYLLSAHGIRLFPEWFTILNPITQDSVVNNLLIKIP